MTMFKLTCVMCGREFYSRHKECRTCSQKCAIQLRRISRMGKERAMPIREEPAALEHIIMPDGTECELRTCQVCGKRYPYPWVFVDEIGSHPTGACTCSIQCTDKLYGYVKRGSKVVQDGTREAG